MSTTTDSLKDLLCADGVAEYVARTEYEAEPRGEKLFEHNIDVQPYAVNWDGRRRGRSVTFYRIFVDGVCVVGGLKKREADKQAKELLARPS